MPNNFAFTAAYINKLDEVFKLGALTASMETDKRLIKASDMDPATVYIKRRTMQGLADYNRVNGYVAGDTVTAWDPYVLTMERGRKFSLDCVDAIEAMEKAAEEAADFMRNQVIPEVDAFRFSKIVADCGVDVSADLTYNTVLAAIDTAVAAFNEAEIPFNEREIYISTAAYQLLKNSGEVIAARLVTSGSGIISRDVTTLDGMPLNIIPPSRFKTAYDFLDGTTQGQEAGGFAPAAGAKNINFMLVYKPSIYAIVKHTAPKLIDPQYNANADGWVSCFRVNHGLFVPTNKKAGVYVHTKA